MPADISSSMPYPIGCLGLFKLSGFATEMCLDYKGYPAKQCFPSPGVAFKGRVLSVFLSTCMTCFTYTDAARN